MESLRLVFTAHTHQCFYLCKRHIILLTFHEENRMQLVEMGGVNTDKRMHQFNWHDWRSSCLKQTFTHSLPYTQQKTPPHTLHWSHNNIFPDLHENVDESNFFFLCECYGRHFNSKSTGEKPLQQRHVWELHHILQWGFILHFTTALTQQPNSLGSYNTTLKITKNKKREQKFMTLKTWRPWSNEEKPIYSSQTLR